MGTQNGVQYAKTQTDPRDMIQSNMWHGRVRCIMDSFEFAGESAGEIINVGKVPKGARIVDAWMLSDDLGTSVTLKMGDSGDDDRLIAATDHASAATLTKMAAAAIDTGFQYEYTAETTIIVTTAGGAATGTLKTFIFYTLD